jgi:hypothetical protein
MRSNGWTRYFIYDRERQMESERASPDIQKLNIELISDSEIKKSQI